MARFGLLPKGTNFYEIAQLPYYNYLAQTARKKDMFALRHEFGKHKRQYLLFFTPKDGVVNDEIIVYFHGGGWTLGSPEMFRSNAQFFVDLGYAVVMPSYRRLPFYRSADMVEDARMAMDKVQEITRAKKWEDKKFLIGGMSSGAHLAALLAYDRDHWPQIPFYKSQLAGIFLFGPPLDLRQMAWTPILWRLAGSRKKPYFDEANPITFVQPGDDIPTIIVHGTNDGLVNYHSTESFLKKRGTKNLFLHTIDQGSHMDAAYWVFRENEIQKVVLKWFEEQSNAK
jgi:acetyl esterase/lipase